MCGTGGMGGRVARSGRTDTVVVMTGAVTAGAVRKGKNDIGKRRRTDPQAKVVVSGCGGQTEPESVAQMSEVDVVLGNTEKMQPATWAGLAGDFVTDPVQVDDIMSGTETAGHLIDGFGTRSRAYVQVQKGCDHRCTF